MAMSLMRYMSTPNVSAAAAPAAFKFGGCLIIPCGSYRPTIEYLIVMTVDLHDYMLIVPPTYTWDAHTAYRYKIPGIICYQVYARYPGM